MANLFPEIRTLTTLVALLLVCAPVAAQEPSQLIQRDMPITLDADSSELDNRRNRLVFKGLRVTQGQLGISADRGEASQLDFEESVWLFTGNVVIESDTARIECARAELTFSQHRLAEAVLTGEPARFRQTDNETGKTTEGEAGEMTYDVLANVVRMNQQARINDGANEITGASITYDMVQQKITADSGDEGPVKILIEPPTRDTGDGADNP